ncbi:hypothetical protein LOTGIDRAFT_231081 [Lottia gigantea]|uniref:Uncharacterized protein n=1 Tax=Lottia gigantea TaxID=225164 RepID=V4AWR5_LOTGI|nr:hypothetical protein LOTGIDRAFT_231081 [Lottia gigantea]ESO99460.1 hypothetical protein LOTGIDRAFT_231081 [Lottia gigantea]
MEDINEFLQQQGLTPSSSDSEKLLHLCTQLQKTQAEVQKAVENEETLKKSQENEMKEVEDYVEHIRRLSDEREALIQELEAENEVLKNNGETKTGSDSSNGTKLKNETKEMLIQQGLDEISNSTVNEQIAFLLAERARLLDELESEEQQPTASDADTARELKQILERERSTFDEQLTHQRASSTLFEEKLKQEHEEEIHCLMEENTQLEDDLADEQAKVKALNKELERLKDDLETEQRLRIKEREERETKEKDDSPKESPRTLFNRPPSPARTSSDLQLRKIIEDKTKLEAELISLRSQIRTLEEEKRNKDNEVSKTFSDYEKIRMENERLQVKNSTLKSHLQETESLLDEADTTVEKLTSSKDSLTKKLAAMELELQTLQDDAEKSSSLKEMVDEFSVEKIQLQSEIDTLTKRLESALSAEDELSQEKMELMSSQEDMTLKVQAALEELNKLKSERETLREENSVLNVSQETQIKTLNELQCEVGSYKLDLSKLCDEKNNLVEEHKNSINKIHQNHEQKSTKQELIIQHMRDQNKKLTSQLDDLKDDMKKLKEEQSELVEEKKSLQMSSQEAEMRHDVEIEDLQTKLKLTLEELGKSKSVIERTLTEKQDLVSQLSKSGELDVQITNTVEDLQYELREKRKQAALFEDERNQRIDLEKKLCEFNNLESEIFTVREECENESRLKIEMMEKFKQMEELYEDQKIELESVKKTLESKIKSLECRNEELEEDLFKITDELQTAQENSVKAEKELQATKVDLQEKSAVMVESSKPLHSAIPNRVSDNLLTGNKVEELETQLDMQSKGIKSYQKQIKELKDKYDNLTSEMTTVNQELDLTKSTMNSYKTKIEKLEIECDTTQELMTSQSKVKKVNFQNKLFQKNGSDETDDGAHSNNVDIDTLMIENQNLSQTLHSVQHELQQTQQALQQEKTTSNIKHQTTMNYSEEERRTHLNRITSLEEISRQLEIDNRDMAKKLSETMSGSEESCDSLQREQLRNTNQLGNRQKKQLEGELETANRQIRSLREDLHQEQAKVFRLEAENVGQKVYSDAKYDSIVKRLETEVADMKEFHRKEIDSITSKLDTALTECQQLQIQIREREQEIVTQENETARMKSLLDRSEAQIETEIKLRSSMENRNKQQEQEMIKVWTQVRSMMEKCSNLENTKHCLEEELSRLTSSSRQSEMINVQKSANQEANITSLEMRSEQAERKNERLQRELDEVSNNLKNMETKARQSESNILEIEDQKDHLIQLKNQLESETLQRTLLDQTVIELKHQVSVLKQHENKVSSENRKLQHSILDLESQLQRLQDEKDFQPNNTMSENGKQNLMEQILRLQKEVKDLQYELLSANEKQEMHEKRYENRKLRTKEKLLKAREFYSDERSRLHDQMQVMDEELRISRSTLRKEVEWRDKIDTNYKHVLKEKRDLISKLTEHEEVLRDRTRSLSVIQVRLKYVEEENLRLQAHIESLNNQRLTMEKISKTSKQWSTYVINY